MRRRAARPLFFIDLAMPRNIAPEVAHLANVFLYNLDDLAKIAAENLALREAEIHRVRALLADKAAAFVATGGAAHRRKPHRGVSRARVSSRRPGEPGPARRPAAPS